MIRLLLFITTLVPFLAMVHPLAQCGEGHDAAAAKSEPDTEVLIAQLSSPDFDERERATLALSRHAERIWARLEQLSKSDDGELRARALRVMSEPGKRTLEQAVRSMEAELAKQEQQLQQDLAALRAQELAEQERERDAQQKLAELERIPEIDDGELEAAQRRNTAAHDAAAARFAAARAEFEKKWSKRRDKRNRISTRIDQFKQLIGNNIMVLPERVPSWSPASLQFASRLSLHVSFEFIDMPLKEALTFISDVTAIRFEYDPELKDKDLAPVTLRVTGMEVKLAMQWICRLAEVDQRIDYDNERIVIKRQK
ncbi:MAG TPA: hypothetical protein VEK08_17995 [Planctomycetota bacterium]|nr:hypothetical protein [Planctomycetota bacterium]